MLINLRNALMAGKRLPYDAELEYLESTGTQWIDTGVIPDTVDLDINIALTVIAQGHLFGSRTNSNFSTTTNHLWSSYGNNAGEFRKDWIAGNAYLATSTTAPNIIGLHSSASGSSIVHDGATLTGVVKTTNSLSLYLFAVNNNGTAATGVLKIYQCKITKNGILVRDFIPVRKGTVGYLYDRVSGKLFGNAGTGDFALGPDVVPVEWLESDGYSYIQTNILPSAGLRTKLRWAFVRNHIAQNSSVFGSRSSGTSTDRYWLNYDGHFELGYGNYHATNVTVTPYEVFDVDFNYIEDGDHKFKINNSAFTASGTPNTSVEIPLFGRIVDTTLSRKASRGYYAEFIRDGVDVGKFLPVRVGTDATSWAGAMMDVLTRRIYRYAGRGAFTYGNDLKYPIPAS